MRQTLMFFFLLLVILSTYFIYRRAKNPEMSKTQIRYVALGDSYTIGENVEEHEAWPSILTRHLQTDGVDIQLVANPARTGWTTRNLIDNELPDFDKVNPTFATLLIGVNDFVQGVDPDTFAKNLRTILDHVQDTLLKKKNIVLVTIPDFSVTPAGKAFGDPGKNSEGIYTFNAIIKAEAKKRRLPVVDIFSLSQKMGVDKSLVTSDGLHPSAKEYSLWEKEIYPAVSSLLQ